MPRLSVSNLAWSTAANGQVLNQLAALGVQGVEVAPTRIAPWGELSLTKACAYRTDVEAAGLRVSSLQAIFFDVKDARLLADDASFRAMSEHTKRVAEVGALLGAEIMVYGAPHTRKRGDVRFDAITSLAVERFSTLGDIAESFGIRIGIEPVPQAYGAEFLTSAAEVIAFVSEVSHPFVRLHLDTACALAGGDSMEKAISDGCALLSHFHAAEPDLSDFSQPKAHHQEASNAMRESGYNQWIAIEMREQSRDPTQALLTAVKYAMTTYLDR